MSENSGCVDVGDGDVVVGGDCVGDGGGGRYKCEPLSQAIQAPRAEKSECPRLTPSCRSGIAIHHINHPRHPWHPYHADQLASSHGCF